MPRELAVLSAVNFIAQVFDPRADRKRFGFNRQLFIIEHFKGVARAVAYRKDNAVGFYRFGLAAALNKRRGYFIVFYLKARQHRFKHHRAAQRDYILADIFNGYFQLVRADMRHCVVKDFIGRSVLYELIKHLALTAVFSAGSQLSVREGSRAALAELNV